MTRQNEVKMAQFCNAEADPDNMVTIHNLAMPEGQNARRTNKPVEVLCTHQVVAV